MASPVAAPGTLKVPEGLGKRGCGRNRLRLLVRAHIGLLFGHAMPSHGQFMQVYICLDASGQSGFQRPEGQGKWGAIGSAIAC